MTRALYDEIGATYTSTRRADPRIAAAIRHGLGHATRVVNLAAEMVSRGVARLHGDLESGEWERRFGHLRQLEAIDVCYRLLVTT